MVVKSRRKIQADVVARSPPRNTAKHTCTNRTLEMNTYSRSQSDCKRAESRVCQAYRNTGLRAVGEIFAGIEHGFGSSRPWLRVLLG